MIHHTARLSLPYPDSDETADVPRDVQALAVSLDGSLLYLQGLLGDRPAPGTAGRAFRATDTGQWFLDTGSAWVEVRTGSAGYTGLQDGVIDAGSFEVTAGGALTVAVASNVGAGAVIAQKLISPAGAAANVALTAAHATLPRVDRVLLGNSGAVSIAAGAPTAGATLANLSGAAAVPAGSVLLADVLVGAAVTVLTNAMIRDRRPWARGANMRVARTGGPLSGGTINSDPMGRVECSGAPLLIGVGFTYVADRLAAVWVEPLMDGVQLPGALTVQTYPPGPGIPGYFHYEWPITPTPGSHTFGFSLFANPLSNAVLTLEASTFNPTHLTVREVLAQDTPNNRTTTG